ncbi:MAG: cell division protein ZapA [Bacteroidales bacterium]|nr:cell division protein ZapA [Bacteroidales bacterium]
MAQNIKIHIADRPYSLKVTSEEQEALIRKAADEVNRKILAYQSKLQGKGIVELLSFAALNLCMSNITLQQQQKAVADEERNLVKELEGYLENIDKNSR